MEWWSIGVVFEMVAVNRHVRQVQIAGFFEGGCQERCIPRCWAPLCDDRKDALSEARLPDGRRGATLETSNLQTTIRSSTRSDLKPYSAVAPIRVEQPKTTFTPRMLNVLHAPGIRACRAEGLAKADLSEPARCKRFPASRYVRADNTEGNAPPTVGY